MRFDRFEGLAGFAERLQANLLAVFPDRQNCSMRKAYMIIPLKEGNSLIPGSQLGSMDGIASVCHQHDILSRQAMMYLLTMGHT